MTRSVRKKLQTSQQALASLLGVSLRYVQKLEAGHRVPGPAIELQLEYLARRDCKVQVLQRRSAEQGDEALQCLYCSGTILVSEPALVIRRQAYCSALCAIRDELSL